MSKTYNLYHEISHDAVAFRYDETEKRVLRFTAAQAVEVTLLHMRLFGYSLKAVPHNGMRGHYSRVYEVERIDDE